jgi:hypothetical protein
MDRSSLNFRREDVMLRVGKTTLLLAIFLVLSAVRARAKGGVAKVVIYGPDWYGELVVDDPELTARLGTAVFEDVGTSPKLPAEFGAGYLLDRYGDAADDARPFDRVLYFSDPSGDRGYVYYLETVNGHGPYDGRWFRASQEGEATIRDVIQAKGVVTSSPPESVRSVFDRLQDALSLVLPLAGILIGWLLGRRERFRRTG